MTDNRWEVVATGASDFLLISILIFSADAANGISAIRKQVGADGESAGERVGRWAGVMLILGVYVALSAAEKLH